MSVSNRKAVVHDGIWDEQHVKALLRFARSPLALIQQNPWHAWIGQRGGLKGVYAFLAEYPFASAHRRMIEVVLQQPEAVADVYADTLHMSRATFFNHLPGAIAAVAQALNQWRLADAQVDAGDSCTRLSLPAPLTSLIGADERIAALELLLARHDVRLLVLLGPGGIGKSRLAIALAQHHAAPTCFVDLAPLVCAADASAAIAAALGVENGEPATLKRVLGVGDFLLVLDNLEHVLEAQSLASELLLACPALKIIATSRIALHAYGEHEYIVPPLETEDARRAGSGDRRSLSPAAELFMARAQSVRPGFGVTAETCAAVEAICALLAGNPLAIELAAFQTKYHAPGAILERLERDAPGFLDKGIKGMPAHQRGLCATLDWSYNLLTPDAQQMFRTLATLPCRFTVEDAERLAPGASETVMTLVDHSLLQHEFGAEGAAHFYMQETARQYALSRAPLL